jgi:hypothetical protein
MLPPRLRTSAFIHVDPGFLAHADGELTKVAFGERSDGLSVCLASFSAPYPHPTKKPGCYSRLTRSYKTGPTRLELATSGVTGRVRNHAVNDSSELPATGCDKKRQKTATSATKQQLERHPWDLLLRVHQRVQEFFTLGTRKLFNQITVAQDSTQ